MWQWYRLTIYLAPNQDRFPDEPLPHIFSSIHAQSWKDAIKKAEDSIRRDAHLKIESATLQCESQVVWGKKKYEFPPTFSCFIIEERSLP
ncbi:MAG: hypothetical protein ACD_12C00155G0002 [uncultured bacterium]|uniref:Uncharacterized protein n=1 Tax=Berkelbacteria bacterium GW2011_GWA2_38_9 TaxID=1618334 RepID=A0A0G0LF08_9BACT|nr:MAG: hypothetical protein ACD_12C00155G0002 [uncultured bacterium]KKQ90473.1 MAG: hypothetical protein UT11_C0005G0014 [Berkelbacteria bacterium GW2011_GWA2_38_9]